MSDTNYHSSRSLVTKQGKLPFQFLPVVVQKKSFCRVVSSSRYGSGLDLDPLGSGSGLIQVIRIWFGSDMSCSGMDLDPAG